VGDASERSAERHDARQAGLLVLGSSLASVASIAVTLLVVRLLGKADVGTLMALVLIYDTLALVVTAGFPQTLLYHLPAKSLPERRAVAWRITTTLMMLGAGASVLLVLGGLFGGRALSLFGSRDPVDLGPLLLFAILPVLDIPARVLPNMLVAEGRARAVTALSVVKSLGQSAAILVPIALGYGVWTVVGCYVVVGLLNGSLLFVFLRILYGRAERVAAPVGHKELFRFAIPLGTTDVVSLLNSSFDRYLILLAFPAAGFATYQAGAWQIPIITYIPYAVGTAFMPRLVEHFKAGRSREALAIWQRSIGKVALLVLPVTMVFIVAAEELVELLFTDRYLDAAPIFRFYATLGLLRVAAYGSVVVAAGQPRYVLLAALLSLGSNVALSIPLLALIGFVGPAMATAVAFVPTVVFYCWCIGRAAGVPLREVFPLGSYARIFAIAALAASVALAFKLTTDLGPAPSLLIEALIVLGVYAAVGTALKVIARDDWEFVWRWLRLDILRAS
jgi:O-antigen/teichoic acid export membrane protein